MGKDSYSAMLLLTDCLKLVFFQEQKCIVLLAEPKYVGQNKLGECDTKSSTFTCHLLPKQNIFLSIG